jgi:hypothetical protein
MDLVDQSLLKCMIDLKKARVADIVRYVYGKNASKSDIRQHSSMFRYRLEKMLGVWLDYNPATFCYSLRDFVIGPGRILITTPGGVFKLECGTTIVSRLDDDRYVVEYLDNLE